MDLSPRPRHGARDRSPRARAPPRRRPPWSNRRRAPTPASPPSLVNAERELADVVLPDLAVRLGRVLESVDSPELDVEGPGGDQPVEPLERVGTRLAVVRQNRHALGSAWRRLDAVGVCDAAALSYRGERRIEALPVNQHQRRIQTAGSELANGPCDVATLALHGGVRSELPHQLDAVSSRSHREHSCAHPLRELDREVPDPAARAVDHQRLARYEMELIVETAQRGHAIGPERTGLLGTQPLRDRSDR